MSKIQFVFIAAFFLLLTLVGGLGHVSYDVQVAVALALIAFFGIPHGAIDHILFAANTKFSAVRFYAFYFGFMLGYGLLWIVAPVASYLLFLLLSAYHFGESQFAGKYHFPRLDGLVLNFSWGISILSGLVLYNYNEVAQLAVGSEDTMALANALSAEFLSVVLITSALVTIVMLVRMLVLKQLTQHQFFLEVYLLAMVHAAFYVLPLLPAFTLYFLLLHSLSVMIEEFDFLKIKFRSMTIPTFVGLLLPFTALSLAGAGILFAFSHYGVINVSNTMLVFILISIVTLPHSIVMHTFYGKYKSVVS